MKLFWGKHWTLQHEILSPSPDIVWVKVTSHPNTNQFLLGIIATWGLVPAL